MISSVAHLWEQQQCERSDLTFSYTQSKLAKLGIEFSESGLEIRKPGENYNNAGLLLSDQNPNVIKVAVFEGTKVGDFIDKKEFGGSLPEQLDKTLDYMKLVIRERNVITGDPQRTVLPDYPSRAVRESILNTYHRDWTMRSDIRTFVFDDRIEVYSPGGAPDNLTVEQLLNGANVKRNPIIIKAMDKLDFIENYNSGIQRILSEYGGFPLQPKFFTDDALFKVTLYNKNYYYDHQVKSDGDTFNVAPDTVLNTTISATLNPTLNSTARQILELIRRDGYITQDDLAELTQRHRTTVADNIRTLKEAGLIERVGSKKTGYWRILK
jgi:predicted HTH transcriptional regulator